MQSVLAFIPGVDVVVLAGAAALVGTILGRCTKRRVIPKPPEKRIEITVQRMDRPYRARGWREASR